MPTDTTEPDTMGDVPTTSRNFRIPDDTYTKALAVATAEKEKVPAVVIRALETYAADPQAFNLACATIRGRRPATESGWQPPRDYGTHPLAAPSSEPTP